MYDSWYVEVPNRGLTLLEDRQNTSVTLTTYIGQDLLSEYND